MKVRIKDPEIEVDPNRELVAWKYEKNASIPVWVFRKFHKIQEIENAPMETVEGFLLPLGGWVIGSAFKQPLHGVLIVAVAPTDEIFFEVFEEVKS